MWRRWFTRGAGRPRGFDAEARQPGARSGCSSRRLAGGWPRRGSALLEAALALAVLAPLAVMAAQFAWGMYQYQSLHSVVEESARYAASSSLRDGVEAWKADVRQFALCGAPRPCARPVVPQLQPSHIGVELVRAAGGPASVRVSIEGFTLAFPGGSRRFDGSPSAQFPRLDATPATDERFTVR